MILFAHSRSVLSGLGGLSHCENSILPHRFSHTFNGYNTVLLAHHVTVWSP